MKNEELTPLEIMEFQDIDYERELGDSGKDTIEYIIKTSTDDTNLYKCLKANIICSRRVYEEPYTNDFEKWDINLFRDIIEKNYYLILFNLNSRWKVSILECFSYDGTVAEQLVSSLISQLHHSTLLLDPAIKILSNPITANEMDKIASTEGIYNSSRYIIDSKDIIKLIIRIKSIIPECKFIGLLALDILLEMYRDEFSIFAFITKVKNPKMKEYINYILHSNEFDSKKLYEMGSKKYYK